MQTFLPYADFDASAAVLDDRRLGKQRVETMQILRALVFPSYRGWKNHPATKMWRGFTPALVAYGVAVCREWERRGRADAVRPTLLEFAGGTEPDPASLRAEGRLPPWLGSASFHRSHRSSLLRKDPEHYRHYFPDEPDDLPYVWPEPRFPRWPVRRGARSLDVDAAAAEIGWDQVTEVQRGIVADLSAGRDVTLDRDQPGAAGVGLLAGLCLPGRTLWVSTADPADPPAPSLTTLRGDAQPSRPGKVTPSIARPPTDDDLAAMAAETAPPEFLFVAGPAVASPARRRTWSDAGIALVVFDGASVAPRIGSAVRLVLR